LEIAMAGLASTIGRSASETGNTNVNSALSRRGLLAGAMILGAAGAGTATPLARLPAATGEWDLALATYLRAKAASDEFENTIAKAIGDEMDRRAPQPADSFTVTASNGQIATYRFFSARADEWEDAAPPLRDPARRLRQEWDAYRRERAAAARDLNWAEISERSDELTTAWVEAETQLIETPAPNAAALARKVILALEDNRGADWCTKYLLADARRLAGH
jgi:hypothetical protein